MAADSHLHAPLASAMLYGIEPGSTTLPDSPAGSINADPAWQPRCTLQPLAYENIVPSQMGPSAQRVVDDFMRMSSEADIVVCIFCNGMGTPTVDERTGSEYKSGTHYE